MIKIKICGITRFVDIEYLNKLRPDYAGFIFAKSKRQITMAHASTLIENLRADIKKVGVFVDEDPATVLAIAENLKLQVLQFHGHEDQEYINKFKEYEIWKALKISSITSISEMKNYNCAKFLLDNCISGSGKSFKWDLIEKKVNDSSIMLAGGLTSENVERGIMKLAPYGVDVSSGVESDGFKNYALIKEFIRKVREL